MKPLYALALALSCLAGCASNSANMVVGTSLSYASLADQRAAALTVVDYKEAPPGATVVGRVDAARCHRNSLQAAPNDEDVRADLRVAAYAKGADGLVDVVIDRSTGILQNCWMIVNGRATAIKR